MSKAQEIIESLQSGDLYTAQKLINEALMIKMGEALEEKLVEFAPSVFNEGRMAKKDYDKDGNLESSTAEWKGSRDRAIKAKMGKVQEDWTNEIPDGAALANALSTYQNTGQMPPELVAYFQQNPAVGTGKKKKFPAVSGQAQIINAGYEPDEDLNSLVESFENDIRDIVQEIQEQTGEQLSEQEIEEIAHQYLDLIGEMAEEEYEEEYEDDEEDEEDQS
jgi:hypothetical protein